MTTEQPDQAPQSDLTAESEIWVSEPITLIQHYDVHHGPGGLSSTVFLPGRHVHPAVQQAAEQVRTAQAERDGWTAELAARGPAREELARKLAQESGRAAGPERVKAARLLTDHDSETNLVAALIPGGDQALREAWEALGASVHIYGGNWDDYLHAQGARAAAALQGAVQTLQTALSEVRLIDGLLARERILHSVPDTPAAIRAQFDRGQRQQSIAALMAGRDHGNEGRQYGLGELASEYQRALTERPQPAAEALPELEPPAVIAQKQRRGLLPTPRDRNGFVVSG